MSAETTLALAVAASAQFAEVDALMRSAFFFQSLPRFHSTRAFPSGPGPSLQDGVPEASEVFFIFGLAASNAYTVEGCEPV